MILSVSRRTDIPHYYSEWFLNRIKEGYLYVRNPMNYHQVSKIMITPDVVDCIVFWSKNPEPMLEKLARLNGYSYYFQFTLTGYGKDIEPFLPHKEKEMIPIFQKLSDAIGKEKVIWRYDPILITDRYTKEYHIKAFRTIAENLNGYCKKVVISFVDLYDKIKKNMNAVNWKEQTKEEILELAAAMAEIAKDNKMEIETCAEKHDLSSCGIAHGCCIDRVLIEKIIGAPLKINKDKNQRAECGCVESIETGAYDTCLTGCIYCYANHGREIVKANTARYDVNSPILCDRITQEDRISVKAVKSCLTTSKYI